MNDYYFFDTCSLLLKGEELFETKFAISSITLNELERIKTSANKDAETKFAARRLLRLLDQHMGEFDIVIWEESFAKPIVEKDLELTNNTKILACAIAYDKYYYPDETIFVTNDLALKTIANLFFGEDSIESVDLNEDCYCGFKEKVLTEEQISNFYSNPNINVFNLQVNEYLILKNTKNEIIDLRCWDGNTHRYLNSKTFSKQRVW